MRYAPCGDKIALMAGSSLNTAWIPLADGAEAVYNTSGFAYFRHPDWLNSSRLASVRAHKIFKMHNIQKFIALLFLNIWIILPFISIAQTTHPIFIHNSALISKNNNITEAWPSAIYIEELNAKTGHPVIHDLINIYLFSNMPEFAPIWPPNHYPYSGPKPIWMLKTTNHEGRIMVKISPNSHDGGISILPANHHDCRPPFYDNRTCLINSYRPIMACIFIQMRAQPNWRW